jgi:hypothetical protein
LVHKKLRDDNENLISLTVGIDGIPFTRSTKAHFWPILAKVDQLNNAKPFFVALFYAKHKPHNLNFLENFIEEVKDLESKGVKIGETIYKFRISCIIADAPARSFIKAVKGHNSYSGCERCVQEGEFHGRVVYSDILSKLRTDEDFRQQTDENHHVGESPLVNIKFGLISCYCY